MKKERKKTKNFPSNGNSSSYIQEGALEASLKDSFKLSGYEARAYISLVKKGAQNAKQLSQNASIPLPRVYDTLDTLMEKGFVAKQEEEEEGYFLPIKPAEALKGRILQFEEQYLQDQMKRRSAEKTLTAALENLSSTRLSDNGRLRPSESQISVLKGLNSIANAFSELLDESHDVFLVAKRSIERRDVFLPLLFNRMNYSSQDQPSSSKSIKLIVPKDAKLKDEEIKAVKDAGVEIKSSENILFDMMIADSQNVLIGVPDPLSKESNHSIAIWIKNIAFARSTRRVLEEIWRNCSRV